MIPRIKGPCHFLWRMLGLIIIFISGVASERMMNDNNEGSTEIQRAKAPEIIEQLEFEDSVRVYINELNIAHPDIVLRQARIESGNFTSTIFKENHNMFGMRVATQRPHLSIGENKGYAVYESWKHSIIDYALLQSWSYKKLNREEYLGRLGNTYAEDPLYIQKVK